MNHAPSSVLAGDVVENLPAWWSANRLLSTSFWATRLHKRIGTRQVPVVVCHNPVMSHIGLTSRRPRTSSCTVTRPIWWPSRYVATAGGIYSMFRILELIIISIMPRIFEVNMYFVVVSPPPPKFVDRCFVEGNFVGSTRSYMTILCG